MLSTKKLDRRARKSRKAIFLAFEALLQNKSYSSITVGDIIEEADIGRTTFYAHFQTKDALLEELCRDIFTHVMAPEPENDHSFQSTATDEKLLHVLYHLADQKDRLAPLFRSPSSHLFWSALLSEVEAFFANEKRTPINTCTSVPPELYSHFLAITFTESAKWWLSESPESSPENIFDIFNELTGIVES